MSVYVDEVRHSYGRMVMCHLWADTPEELFAMVDAIGVRRKWLQQPPKASWVHFDISLGKKEHALRLGAILTDKYGPAEFEARRRGDTAMLARITACRALKEKGRRVTSTGPSSYGSSNMNGRFQIAQTGGLSPDQESTREPLQSRPHSSRLWAGPDATDESVTAGRIKSSATAFHGKDI